MLESSKTERRKMSPTGHDEWQPFHAGKTCGEIGTEAGVILRDEEHVEGARITLERVERRRRFRRPVVRYAITCGIYDWMVHTRCFLHPRNKHPKRTTR